MVTTNESTNRIFRQRRRCGNQLDINGKGVAGMTKWMNSGNGIYLVQAMRVKSKAELKVEMDALELQIQEAERYWAERKGLTA